MSRHIDRRTIIPAYIGHPMDRVPVALRVLVCGPAKNRSDGNPTREPWPDEAVITIAASSDDDEAHDRFHEVEEIKLPLSQLRALIETTEEDAMTSVLQDWVTELPLREQGTLLTAVRGCDDEPKLWTARGISDSPGRRVTAFIRWCFMNPADPREVDIPGAFFQSSPPDPFKPSEFGHLPQHWYAHAMHALEVIAYRHPRVLQAGQALRLYHAMVHNLHLRVESKSEMIERLSEDRIASGKVVS